MSRDVTPALKDKGPCECDVGACDLFGTLGRPDKNGKRHVKGCKENGCKVCLGRNSHRAGDDKARVGRKRMGLAGANTRHEEHWGGPVRVEFKSGKQVQALATRFLDAEAQSEAARPIGDHRPFAFGAMPLGWGNDGIVAVRLSTWETLIRPLLADAS